MINHSADLSITLKRKDLNVVNSEKVASIIWKNQLKQKQNQNRTTPSKNTTARFKDTKQYYAHTEVCAHTQLQLDANLDVNSMTSMDRSLKCVCCLSRKAVVGHNVSETPEFFQLSISP